MKIHKEGAPIILCAAALAIVLAVLSFWLLPTAAAWIVSVTAWIGVLFITSFFRSPSRPLLQDDGAVYSPADGTIVALEEVEEKEYFKDNRIVVSVFMSIWNVHINWFPVSGTVDYFRHHHGLFLVAWHPKSSEDNERTTTVVDMGGQKIMFRQIAGMVARRIVSYARAGTASNKIAVRIHQVRLAGRSVYAGRRQPGQLGDHGRYANADRAKAKQ
ncbi:MAG: phosphatidylserine decarboxylase [Alistipes sp.]